jgi:hypothetical protein
LWDELVSTEKSSVLELSNKDLIVLRDPLSLIQFDVNKLLDDYLILEASKQEFQKEYEKTIAKLEAERASKKKRHKHTLFGIVDSEDTADAPMPVDEHVSIEIRQHYQYQQTIRHVPNVDEPSIYTQVYDLWTSTPDIFDTDNTEYDRQSILEQLYNKTREILYVEPYQ